MSQREPIQEQTLAWETELEAMHGRIRARFVHPEAHRRALAYLKGLLGSVERKNGWQLASHAGDARPDGMQRLLSTYRWDADGVRDDLRDYVVEHLGDERAVLVVDEIGFLKRGRESAGVERQYNQTAGQRENCQVGIFLAYLSRRGCAILDRELYLSEDWDFDWDRKERAGVPDELPSSRSKDELARDMIDRALEAGVPCAWVVADALCCNDYSLRRGLEEQGVAYVMAVKDHERLLTNSTDGLGWLPARQLAQRISLDDWERFSAGEDGGESSRHHDWARVPLRTYEYREEWYWLLVRRDVTDPADLNYYTCFGRADVSLAELARVAEHARITADTFKAARREVGLDQYEVRRWTGWHRHITLAMVAHAVLAVTRYRAALGDEEAAGSGI